MAASFRSAPVRMATTPFRRSARLASSLMMRACGYGLRKILPCSMPGASKLPVKVTVPRTRSAPSGISAARPTSGTGALDHFALWLPYELSILHDNLAADYSRNRLPAASPAVERRDVVAAVELVAVDGPLSVQVHDGHVAVEAWRELAFGSHGPCTRHVGG